MEAIAYYLKANLVFLVLFAIYQVALRRETWFHARRAWLLATATLAMVLPLVPAMPTALTSSLAIELPVVELTPAVTWDGANWTLYLFIAHISVTLALLVRLCVRCFRVITHLKRSVIEPSSFFHIVRVPGNTDAGDRDALVAHERVHAQHGHSFDVIAYEIIAAIFWNDPLWRMALRELRLVHEHTADSIARTAHTNYAGLLLAHALGVPSRSLLNTFGSTNLKQRMIMLQNSRPPRLARRKLLLAVPALALAIMLVSWQAVPDTDRGMRALKALVFVGVDQQPEFPGGMEALTKHLGANIRYPEQAKTDKVEGIVHIGFTVKANGSVADANVKRGVRADIDAEALRVVSGMPKWKPATANGKAVDAQMTLPIAFRLGADK